MASRAPTFINKNKYDVLTWNREPFMLFQLEWNMSLELSPAAWVDVPGPGSCLTDVDHSSKNEQQHLKEDTLDEERFGDLHRDLSILSYGGSTRREDSSMHVLVDHLCL